MKEKMQQAIDAIVKMAEEQKEPVAPRTAYNGPRPDNSLSRSIRNQKEAEQFQVAFKAVIEHVQNK